MSIPNSSGLHSVKLFHEIEKRETQVRTLARECADAALQGSLDIIRAWAKSIFPYHTPRYPWQLVMDARTIPGTKPSSLSSSPSPSPPRGQSPTLSPLLSLRSFSSDSTESTSSTTPHTTSTTDDLTRNPHQSIPRRPTAPLPPTRKQHAPKTTRNPPKTKPLPKGCMRRNFLVLKKTSIYVASEVRGLEVAC